MVSVHVDPSTDAEVLHLRRTISGQIAIQGQPPSPFFHCLLYGSECTIPHVVPVRVVQGLSQSTPFTPDDLHINGWMKRYSPSRSGVFHNGIKRYTGDYVDRQGRVSSYTLYWEHSVPASKYNRPIMNSLKINARNVRSWKGVALLVKHVGLRVVDITADDEIPARVVLARYVTVPCLALHTLTLLAVSSKWCGRLTRC